MHMDTDEVKINLSFEINVYLPNISEIINYVCQILIFCVGLFIHIKIIQVSYVEKSKTWMMQITHAVTTSILFGFLSPFTALTHIVANLSSYIGSWICYVASFIIFYGIFWFSLYTHSRPKHLGKKGLKKSSFA